VKRERRWTCIMFSAASNIARCGRRACTGMSNSQDREITRTLPRPLPTTGGIEMSGILKCYWSADALEARRVGYVTKPLGRHEDRSDTPVGPQTLLNSIKGRVFRNAACTTRAFVDGDANQTLVRTTW
jgi:hypothetical protein